MFYASAHRLLKRMAHYSTRLGVTGMLCGLSGCGFGTVPLTSTSANAVSNNWEIQVIPSVSGSGFSHLSGSIIFYSPANGSQRATSTLIADGACFALSPVIPLDGNLAAEALTLDSFEVRYQFLNLTSTLDATQSHLSGTYVVYGGCGNGQQGTIAGTRYSPLTGSYVGVTGETTLNFDSTQSIDPTGIGTFLLSGTLAFSGPRCTAAASLIPSSSYVSGKTLTMIANLPDGTATVVGIFSSDAKNLTLSTINVSGGVCAGSYSTATLVAQ